jgi:hypothetical protein
MVNRFIYGDENSSEVKKILAAHNIRCAVAFWGIDIAEEIIKSKQEIKIVCNLGSGACNPSAIEKLIEHGAQIKTNDVLHAKVYISDELAIVGSANASSNGLGYEDSELAGWIEASIITSDKEIIGKASSWFAGLWDSSNPIDNDMLEKAKLLWAKRRASRLPRAKNKLTSLSELLKTDLSDFKDKNYYMAIYEEDLSNDAEKELERIKELLNNSKLTCYEDWKGLRKKPSGLIVCDFFFGPRGGVKFDGLYETINIKSENECVFGVSVTKNYLLNLINSDLSGWREGIKKIKSSKVLDKFHDESAIFISVYDALSFLKTSAT